MKKVAAILLTVALLLAGLSAFAAPYRGGPTWGGRSSYYRPHYEPHDPDPEPYDPEPEPYDPEPYDPEPYDPEPYDPEPYDPEPYDPEPYREPERVKAIDGNTNVRTGPSLSADILGVMHVGESAEFTGGIEYDYRNIAWYSIIWNGRDAWVSSVYTEIR